MADEAFGTPAELLAAVTCPVKRLVWITALAGHRGNLPRPWAAQRKADFRLALRIHRQKELAQELKLSTARVSQLAALALRESTS